MNILLGVTGSVAAKLLPKIVKQLDGMGTVMLVVTNSATNFYSDAEVRQALSEITHGIRVQDLPQTMRLCGIFDDDTEWLAWNTLKEKPGSPVLHIDLRKWADIMVIAPLSANTLAKISNGICDNLLTSVVRAWDWRKPMVLAPAMNTMMWQHPLTDEQLNRMAGFGAVVTEPQRKVLVCGDEGPGAMADIEEVVRSMEHVLRWKFPLERCNGVPIEKHPGAFGYQRRKDMHTGVDLYTREGEDVFAVEAGTVVKAIPFTGSKLGHTWWNDTDALLVQGASGVVCYGEIAPLERLIPGALISKGEHVGYVVPVVQKGRERPDIPGHSRSMLHLELYKSLYDDLARGVWEGWEIGEPQPERLLDPTPKILEATNCPCGTLTPRVGPCI